MAGTTSQEIAYSDRAALEQRILDEGYGPGAWHGPDIKAALEDVAPALAFWRPAAGRHNIAEIAIHHAYTVHVVRTRLGPVNEAFALEGDDWFPLEDGKPLSWDAIRGIVESEQQKLRELVSKGDAGQGGLQGEDRFAQVLGITCHAVYHAGQVQLIKRLNTRT
jgi:hypothetical protein